MKTSDLVERWMRQPEMLRRGAVLRMAARLGLGQRRVAVLLAGAAWRVRCGEQWRYPREKAILLVLDAAGLVRKDGALAVGTAGVSEGAPGSTL
jgi:hypothetical protein